MSLEQEIFPNKFMDRQISNQFDQKTLTKIGRGSLIAGGGAMAGVSPPDVDAPDGRGGGALGTSPRGPPDGRCAGTAMPGGTAIGAESASMANGGGGGGGIAPAVPPSVVAGRRQSGNGQAAASSAERYAAPPLRP